MIGSISQIDGVVTPEFKNRMRAQMLDRFPAPVDYGILPNSVDLIWKDMTEQCIGAPVATSGGMGQYCDSEFIPAYNRDIPKFNIWMEIDEEGDPSSSLNGGNGCLKSINKATNTRVEIGTYRGWWLDKSNNWHEMNHHSISTKGIIVPRVTSVFGGLRQCDQNYFKDIRAAHWNQMNTLNTLIRPEANGHASAKPEWYFRWHGFGGQTTPPTSTSVKAVFVQLYARLIVENPNKVDDRHKARYLMHVASDHKNEAGQTVLGSLGISRYKRVTNDWQPFNMITKISKEELEQNPPPFVSEP